MKLIKPSYEILSDINGEDILKSIELAGRTCYKSEDRITKTSAAEFVKMILKRGHESVIEHISVSVRFICDRGVSHELVRHRLASFSQESTRYCNYSTDQHDNQLTFILPPWLPEGLIGVYKMVSTHDFKDFASYLWFSHLRSCEIHYLELLKKGWVPQQARSVLPNALKTEIVVTANLREWRLIFKQRTAKAAHPQMTELMRPLLRHMCTEISVIFDDITYEK